jgi:gliding motility-associated-like protein
MRTRIFFIFILLIQICKPDLLQASHIIGGEIYYDCLGSGQFRITLKLYRDCYTTGAEYDNPANVGIYNASGGLYLNLQMPLPNTIPVIPIQNINPCYQGGATICVQEAVYTQVISLPYSPGGYTLVYQRCCRNPAILNLNNPSEAGLTNTIQIPDIAWTTCNSSPRYSLYPPIVMCLNDIMEFNHVAIDPDGDVLEYSLCAPYDGATSVAPMPIPPPGPPFSFVNFSPPYTATNPIPASVPTNIQSTSGLLRIKPSQTGQYVLAVCVSEYRNGVLLSVNKRDFQFQVVACDLVTNANFTPSIQGGNAEVIDGVLTLCGGLQVQFSNSTTVSGAGAAANSSIYSSWDFGVNSINTDVSEISSPVYTYPDSGSYNVLLIANKGFSCADTLVIPIAVYREVIAEINNPAAQCITNNAFNFQTLGQHENNATYAWTFGGPASQASSTQRNPSGISWSTPGVYPVTLVVSDPHCSDDTTINITVFDLLNVDISVSDSNACEPARIQFTNLSSNSPGALFTWDFGDGEFSTSENPVHEYTEDGIYNVQLSVQNIIGCIGIVNDSFPSFITIRPSPISDFDATPRSTNILLPEITFTDLSTNFLDSWLEPGDGTVIDFPNVIYSYADTGSFDAQLHTVNAEGCYDTAHIEIRIDPVYTCYIPNAFTPNGDDINETFRPVGEGFKSYELIIFDRWGREVFQTNDSRAEWDGRINGGELIAQSGVFNYKLIVRDILNVDYSYTGIVTLVR